MSGPGEPPRSGPPAAARGGCLAPLLGLIGVVLLLPGICSLLSVVEYLLSRRSEYIWAEVWVVTFFIAAGGIVLIRYALRNSARPGRPHDRP